MQKLAGVLMIAACWPVQGQMANFNTTTNVLTLDALSVNGQYFSGVSLDLNPGRAWSITGSPRLISPLSVSDAATYTNNQLTIPRTQVGTVTYDNFVLNLPVGSVMSLARIGSVSSASSPGYNTDIFPIRSKIKNSAETDSGGELTYALTNGQVWKHFIDEPCMPTGIGTDDPDGYSDVEIYPNPGGSGSVAANEGNFRFVNYWPSKAEALKVETCLVTPVSGVFGVSPEPSLNDVMVAPAELSGVPGEGRNLSIFGGTPPYKVVIDSPGLADFYFLNGSELSVKMLRAGTGSFTVYDFNKSIITVPITVAGQNFYPPGLDGFTEGTSVEVTVMFGSPPYQIVNPLSPHIQVTPIGDAATTNKFRLYLASVPPSSGELNVGFMVTDVFGYSSDFPISNFQPNPQYETAVSLNGGNEVLFIAGDEFTLPISGGRPPYTGRASASDVFSTVQARQTDWGWELYVKVKRDYIPPYGASLPTYQLVVRDSSSKTAMIEAKPNYTADGGFTAK
jgi:hypothetical protein